jgi:large subunit ribosomal protein L9
MAKNVEVLLREHVKDLGRCGDVVKVSPGFARNFLVPRGIAMQATEENKKAMSRRRLVLDAQEKLRQAELAAKVSELSALVLTTSARADENGQLFGSVNAAAIAELLRAAGHGLAEDAVRLDAPIRTIGTHSVRVHLHGEHEAVVSVEVQAASA